MFDYRLRLTKAIVECYYQGCPLRERCDLSLRQLFVTTYIMLFLDRMEPPEHFE